MIREFEQRAKEFATLHHCNQKRKYTNLPYITHSEAVANIVRSVNHTQEMLAAAWLHDIIEDCPNVSVYEFGSNVETLVHMLTKVGESTDSREHRAYQNLIHLSKASNSAKTIKLADIIDNTKDIAILDPEFASTYLKEKQSQLFVLTEGDSVLWTRANLQIIAGLESLQC